MMKLNMKVKSVSIVGNKLTCGLDNGSIVVKDLVSMKSLYILHGHLSAISSLNHISLIK